MRNTINNSEVGTNKIIKKISNFGLYMKIFGILFFLVGIVDFSEGILILPILFSVYGAMFFLSGGFIQRNKEKNIWSYIKCILVYLLIFGIVQSILSQRLSPHLFFFVAMAAPLYLDHQTWKYLHENTEKNKSEMTYLMGIIVSGFLITIY